MTSAHSVWVGTGCSSGFGRESARILVKRGHQVVVTARNPAALEEFASARNALVAALDVKMCIRDRCGA